ncbi:MAG: 4-(cytidine 5'-diphospho)-2-C-methyl-D-erythritol kinase [Rikenellaceae bacterium]
MTTQANCKINIGLDILSRCEDGFHDLSTVMYPIKGLYDEVRVTPLESYDIEFASEGIAIDCPSEDNLCVRAAKAMQLRFFTPGVRITLNKTIPFGAGLGGGSSDATAVITAMNKLFDLRLSPAELVTIAATLGSDTAFFVHNSPQLCCGRGEIMTPIKLDLSPYHIVLVKPEVGISTAQAYGGVTPAAPSTPLAELIARPIEEWQEHIKNDFEPHIFEAYPILERIKSELLECGALYASMSGSGSTIYGIFSEVKQLSGRKFGGYDPYIFKL